MTPIGKHSFIKFPNYVPPLLTPTVNYLTVVLIPMFWLIMKASNFCYITSHLYLPQQSVKVTGTTGREHGRSNWGRQHKQGGVHPSPQHSHPLPTTTLQHRPHPPPTPWPPRLGA